MTEATVSSQRELMKRALLEVQNLRASLATLERERDEPIAIVGMGMRLPGGTNNSRSFWQMVRDGKDAIGEIPADRWDVDALYDPDPEVPGKSYTRRGGFLDQIDQFDPAFFRISPRDATCMDPQQRLVIEVAWEALENAGVPIDSLAGSSTGVFIGCLYGDYALLEFSDLPAIEPYTGAGAAQCILANRLSYVLDLRGPSLALDSACSSSLVALHLACESLRRRESDMALVGGVNVICDPAPQVALCRARMLAPDGRCKTFDARADGYGRGEGCGVLVLKRLSDARASADRILALVRGAAVNQDGRTAGLTAPNGLAQQAVIRKALAGAGVNPSEVAYIEAHGTGTPLGDPIEMEALAAVYGVPSSLVPQCVVGSVKANIGHLEAAAGVAGLIKIILAFQNESIPPQCNFERLNPNITLGGTRLVVPTSSCAWPSSSLRRLAAISGFGFGGTNAHVILEEPPPPPETTVNDSDTAYLLPLSARGEAYVKTLAEDFGAFLSGEQGESVSALHDVCYTSSLRRSHFEDRLAVVGSSPAEMAEQLRGFVSGARPAGVRSGCSLSARPHKLVFVCSGQGAQWPGMGRALCSSEPLFRDALESCDALIRDVAGWSLLLELDADSQRSRLGDTEIAQPAIFALQVALAALWRAWGIEPAALVGHSVGEIAAAHLAGALSLEDAVQIVCLRGRLMQQATGSGRMAAVGLTADEATSVIAPYGDRLALAAINGPRSVVLSGEAAALGAVEEQLRARQAFCRDLGVNYAFHSPQMQPFADALRNDLQRMLPQATKTMLYSTVTGAVIDGRSLDADYWAANVRQPVRFGDAVQSLVRDGHDIFVELGGHPVLASAIEEGLGADDGAGLILPSLRRRRDERRTLLDSLAALHTRGLPIAWSQLYPGGGQVVSLPAARWQRHRFWWDTAGDRGTGRRSHDGHPLLGKSLTPSLQADTHYWETSISLAAQPYLGDHRVAGAVVVPGAVYAEMACAAAADTFGPGGHVVSELRFERPLLLPEGGARNLQMIAVAEQPGRLAVQVVSRDAADVSVPSTGWTLHARAVVCRSDTSETPSVVLPEEARNGSEEVAEVALHYAALEQRGLQYGPGFQAIRQLWRRDGEATAKLQISPVLRGEARDYQIHPALLDAAFQTLAASVPKAATEGHADDLYLPVGIDRFVVHTRSRGPLWASAQLREMSPEELVGDVRLIDETGCLVAEVLGFRARPAALGAASVEEFFYRLRWQMQPLGGKVDAVTPSSEVGGWLVLQDRKGFGEVLAAQIEASGRRCVCVARGTAYRALGDDRYEVDAALPEDIGRVFEAAFSNGSACHGLVHLWSLDAVDTTAANTESLAEARVLGCESTLHLLQAVMRSGAPHTPRLWLVTRGAQAVDETADCIAVAQAPLCGLGKVIAHEHPELCCTRLDLDPAAGTEQVGTLFLEICSPDGEDEVAWRAGDRYVSRLVRGVDGVRPSLRPAPARGAFRLEADPSADFDRLTLHSVERRAPLRGEVEVKVEAAGVSFRDVSIAVGSAPDSDTQLLGGECAGTISAVGPGVESWHVGDPVIALGSGSLGAYVTTRVDFVARRPGQLTAAQSAGFPLATMAAVFALRHVARLRCDERILILGASGGVGLASVQVAQQAGAKIVATAGTEEKRDLLRSLGIAPVLDSRAASLPADLDAAAVEGGFDVVLECTPNSDPPMADLLAAGGRWCTLASDTGRGLLPGRNRVSAAIDLSALAEEQPALIAALLREVIADLTAGRLQPLPTRAWPISEASEVFRRIAERRCVGKNVLTMHGDVTVAPPRGGVRPDASYLVTGGLGGLGSAVARWLVERGARSLILIGRRPPSPEAAARLEELRAAGVRVEVRCVDVSDTSAMEKVLREAERDLPPLAGVVHAAGVLDDGILFQQSAERFRAVMTPKVQGAWNLHALTTDRALDFFILFSSVASLVGSPGQGNYTAANSFLDALAHHRRVRGLPGLSINWGPWSEVGMAAEASRAANMEGSGINSLTPSQGIAALQWLLLQGSPAQVGVMALNLPQWQRRYPRIAELPLLAELMEGVARDAAEEGQLRDALLALNDGSARLAYLENYVREQLGEVLGLDPLRIDPHAPLLDLGFDSLMMVELKNRLDGALGVGLSPTMVFNYPTVAALAPQLGRLMGLAPATSNDGAVAPPVDAAADRRLAELSEEDAEAMLSAQLDDWEGRGGSP